MVGLWNCYFKKCLNLRFTEKLAADNNMKTTKEFASWKYRQHLATENGGYAKTFDYNSGKVIVDLLTVKGAGHLVPIDRPGPAMQVDQFPLEML